MIPFAAGSGVGEGRARQYGKSPFAASAVVIVDEQKAKYTPAKAEACKPDAFKRIR